MLEGGYQCFSLISGGLFDLRLRTRRDLGLYPGRELKMERLMPLLCSQVSLEALGQA